MTIVKNMNVNDLISGVKSTPVDWEVVGERGEAYLCVAIDIQKKKVIMIKKRSVNKNGRRNGNCGS